MTMAGPPGGRELKTVPIISVHPDSNHGTSDSNVRSRASSVLSKASAAHDHVKNKSKNVLGELMRVKKEIEMPDRASKLRFEAGGSDSEAGDVPSPKSDLELSSSSLADGRERSSSSETNEFWDHDP